MLEEGSAGRSVLERWVGELERSVGGLERSVGGLERELAKELLVLVVVPEQRGSAAVVQRTRLQAGGAEFLEPEIYRERSL